ncbi:MAG: polysaccharide biosynthesis/export family protein, partial [Bacteroidota bacterium]
MKSKRNNRQFLIIVAMVTLLSSCKLYKQDVMFQLDEDFSPTALAQAVKAAQANYKIQPNDYLSLDVYSNDGELIIDPNFELLKEINPQANQVLGEIQYLVQFDGRVKLPMVGMVNIAGLTIQEAEAKLEKLYDASYKNTFVKIAYLNKRVFVLGANGGQVVSLANDNMSVIEAI